MTSLTQSRCFRCMIVFTNEEEVLYVLQLDLSHFYAANLENMTFLSQK